jgi:hypothetical protein
LHQQGKGSKNRAWFRASVGEYFDHLRCLFNGNVSGATEQRRANVKRRPSDFNRAAPGENAFTLQKKRPPHQSLLQITPSPRTKRRARRSIRCAQFLATLRPPACAGSSPAASPPCAFRLASLRPTAHAGPLPSAGGCLCCLLISLRPLAPRLSGPPPHLTPPPPVHKMVVSTIVIFCRGRCLSARSRGSSSRRRRPNTPPLYNS